MLQFKQGVFTGFVTDVGGKTSHTAIVARSLDIPAVVGAIGLLLSAHWADNTLLAMSALTLATACIITTLPLFWSLPTAFLAGTGAAAGIAMINSLGNLAGFASPYAVGWLKQASGTTSSGMVLLASSLILGAILTISVPAKLVNK